MSQRQMSVLYDDECGLCRSQVRRIQRWDRRQRLDFVPVSDPRAMQLAPGLDRETMLTQIHCVDSGGQVLGGVRCLRQLGLHVPLLAPLALGLWIPGALWIADRIYRWISRHRHTLSRKCGCR